MLPAPPLIVHTSKLAQVRASAMSAADLERLRTTTAATSDSSPFKMAVRNVIAACRSSPLALAAYVRSGVVSALATSLTQVSWTASALSARFFAIARTHCTSGGVHVQQPLLLATLPDTAACLPASFPFAPRPRIAVRFVIVVRSVHASVASPVSSVPFPLCMSLSLRLLLL